jgi:hypothetical protein
MTATACGASPDECAGRLRLPEALSDLIFHAVDDIYERRRSDLASTAL